MMLQLTERSFSRKCWDYARWGRGKLAQSGETRFDGKTPINTSGGLESKGHPIGATGLSMINEIAMQLRGEAEKRQVKNAEIGMVENGGGVVSFEEFACGVTILQKSDM